MVSLQMVDSEWYTNLNIELNSLLIIEMLKDRKANSFKLNKVIKDTSNIFLLSQQLSKGAKGPFLIDKRQILNIRSKFDKANFYVI